MPIDVILGLQWGDEGKGKLVDTLAAAYQTVARFQGGPNAGHTLCIDDHPYVLHQIPSGILQPNTQNLIGDGVVLDPIGLQKEIDQLKAIAPTAPSRLYIARGAHLLLPLHKALDEYEERHRGLQKIGSTGKGIGPCYQDKYARRGLRIADLHNLKHAQKKYEALKSWHAPYLSNPKIKEEEKAFWQAAAELLQYRIVDGTTFIQRALASGQRILAEGAQGTLLDIDHGTYPYVTSSHTSIGGVCTGLGVSPKQIGRIYGVSKAYCTRVGEGPFPTEEDGPIAQVLSTQGQEFGATTGRRRRCGWLDLPALRYAITRNGIDTLLLTKIDVLAGIKEIKLCTSYQQKNEHSALVQRPEAHLRPHYEHLPGWDKNSSYTNEKQWPPPLHTFLTRIEKEIKIPIAGLSYGAAQKDFIYWKKKKTPLSKTPCL